MRKIDIQPAISGAVTTEIRNAILDGTLAPGARIKQEELAARLHVSRAPIRQALVVLERESLVRTLPRRGAIVAPLDPTFLGEIYEVRAALEGYLAARLALHRDFDPAPLRQAVAEGQKAASSGDLDRLIQLDLAFHMGLYDALGNQLLKSFMMAQWVHIRRAMAVTLTSGYRKRVWSEHAAVLEAIAAGQAAKARAHAIAHLRSARKVLLSNLKRILKEQHMPRARPDRAAHRPPRRARPAAGRRAVGAVSQREARR